MNIQVAKLEAEFDSMDVLKQGYLSRFFIRFLCVILFVGLLFLGCRDGLVSYFTAQYEKNSKEGSLDKLMGRRDRGAKRLDPGAIDLINAQVEVRFLSFSFFPC